MFGKKKQIKIFEGLAIAPTMDALDNAIQGRPLEMDEKSHLLKLFVKLMAVIASETAPEPGKE